MIKKHVIYVLIVLVALTPSCKQGEEVHDASGSFEADEVIVSAESAGRILEWNVEEGLHLFKDSAVGRIDATGTALQKEQVQASIESLSDKTLNVSPQVKLLQDQIAVQQSQLDNLLQERQRLENLVKRDAATGKQLDDMDAQITVARKNISVTAQQISVQKNNIASQNRAVLSEGKPLEKRVAQLNDQLSKSRIINPVEGTVLASYAELGEVTAPGKALYKIADLRTLNLRAYVTGTQLPEIKIGQEVQVLVDSANSYKIYPGKITWISDKAEFTPKTIQTKEERANLVYAIKVKVPNDGSLKIGMYAELEFAKKN